MNKKKCPKCGEENPAEAVMCWACYTPLSGSAAAAGPAGAAKGVGPISTGDEGEKKKIAPWQLGVLGVGALALAYFGIKTFVMPSSGGGDDDDDSGIAATKKDDGGGDQPAGPAPSSGSPVVINPTTGNATVMPSKAPFTVVSPPNPKLSVATMAIVPTDSGVSGPQAAALAAYTRRQYAASKKWSALFVYVFADSQSASGFANYQARRRGAPLSDGDLATLSSLWNNCLARYEYSDSGGKRIERVLYPSKNPSGWWYGR